VNSFNIIFYNFSNNNENIENFVVPELSITSGVIFIDGNQGWQDFKDAGSCTGYGNSTHPYIIRDLIIDGEGTHSYCIYILKSNVYFIIENCTFFNSTYGVRLINVVNAHLNNITCHDNNNGISITNSNNSTISNCNLINNKYQGIDIQGNNITLQNNTIMNSFWGILLTQSNSCNLMGNKMIKCGLLVLGISYNEDLGHIYNEPLFFDHLIDTDNRVNGKPLYFYKNDEDLDNSDFIDAGQIILFNCSNSVIRDFNLSFASIGVQLYSSHYCTVDNMIVNNNSYGGIFVLEGSNNVITNNIACNNTEGGIIIASAIYNTISDNRANDNKEGIAIKDYWGIGSDYNEVFNNFVENNSFSGITVYRSDYNQIGLNEIHDNKYGIYMDNCQYSILSANAIYKNLEYGIYLYKSENNLISDNIISNNNIGIFLKYSENNYINLNSFYDNQQDIFTISEYIQDPFLIPSIFIILIIILLISLTGSLVAISIYKNFSLRTGNLYSEEKNKKKDLYRKNHTVKSSKEIISEISNQDLLIQIFNPVLNHGIEEEISSEDTLLSAMSEEFLDKVDKLGLNENDKKEFLKDMFSFKPSERLDIVNMMLLKSNFSK